MSLCVVLLSTTLAGCIIPDVPEGFDSPDPNRRLDAIVDAAERGDRSAVRSLVILLESADAAARVLSIRTLEDLTGQTLGYDPYGSDRDRADAVERWAAWLGEQDRKGAEMRRQPPSSAGSKSP